MAFEVVQAQSSLPAGVECYGKHRAVHCAELGCDMSDVVTEALSAHFG